MCPNWCENELIVRGNKEQINLLKKNIKNKKTELDFDKIIPYPKKFRELDKKAKLMGDKGFGKDGYNQGGYEWCIKNWGTKWNACDISTYENSIGFSTAWSPPCPIIKKLSKMFPKLTFTLKYWECGVGYRGIFKCKNNEVLKDDEYTYRGNRGG